MRFLKRFILLVIANALIFWSIQNYILLEKFVITPDNWQSHLYLSICFGVLNFFVHPILNILTLPIRFITLGLFSVVINGVLLWLLEQSVNFLEIFKVDIYIENWFIYFIAGTLIAIGNTFSHWFLK